MENSEAQGLTAFFRRLRKGKGGIELQTVTRQNSCALSPTRTPCQALLLRDKDKFRAKCYDTAFFQGQIEAERRAAPARRVSPNEHDTENEALARRIFGEKLMRTARHSLAFVAFALLFCAATSITSSAQTLTTLYSFCTQMYCPDGAEPVAAPIQASDGNLYGTTQGSILCNYGCGSVFRITPNGDFTTLYTFCSQSHCADGANPTAALLQATDGNLYGTTLIGGTQSGSCNFGSGGCGTIFKITPSGALTTLYTFCPHQNCLDGNLPTAALVQASDGNFYGTTFEGGAFGAGTIFKVTTTGTLTTLYSFCAQQNCPDGREPGTLIQATDGNFYGTTFEGGASDNGTVFRITPSGMLTTLHSFDISDGAFPEAGLVQATDGNFYGVTGAGGYYIRGTIFRITPSGTLTTLYSFGSQQNDGVQPLAALMQASNGSLYGSTSSGGAHNGGTLFKVTLDGTLTSLYSFCTEHNCTDGSSPRGGLLQAADGNLYGTTFQEGSRLRGTVFSFTGPSPTAVQFVPITPCRLVDTRQTQTPIVGGTFQFFNVPQLGNCNIPSTAAAYSLNVTVVPHQHLGYLTIWPAGRPQPTVSTMNSPDGRTKANAAIVPSGADAAVSVFATDTTNVILDINGYFTAPGSGTLQFYTLPPCRIVDTRNNQHGGTLRAGVERDYTIPTNCGVPRSAQAYSFNITAIPPSGGLDYLTVWPKGETRPVVSTLNDNTGTIVANAAIVPAGPDNATAFYAHSNQTDLLIDVNGYFAPPGTGGLSLYPVAPCRVLDTRSVGSGQPFQGVYNSPDGINVVTSPCAPPSTSKAFVFNATVVPPGAMPFLTLWPHGMGQPTVSTLNAYDGFITSNMAIVPSNDGSINAYAAGLTQLIMDISGYFAP